MKALDALEPRLLRSFVTVAEELHFGRAAKRLHMSQPPLSVQIQKLERELGVRLFERDRRKVLLTEAGAFLLSRAKHLLVEAERVCIEAERIARGEAGVLAIGYTPTATFELLPSLIRRFRKRSPDVRLELMEMRSALQLEALTAGRIEIGFACGPLSLAAPGASVHDGLVEHVLARERFFVALPRRHRLAARRSVRVDELHGEASVIVRMDVERAWATACDVALRRAGVVLQVVQETDTKIALLGLIAAGVGLSVVSESMTHIRRSEVVFRKLTGFALTVPLVGIIGAKPSPRASALMHLALAT
jgi:DNA-binding transcriptional LysR family regulator